jgi:hypothetical protein
MNEKITIEIDRKWVRRVKSPWYWLVAALTGVSVSFAPLFLYQCGKGEYPYSEISWWLAPSCFAVIYLVPSFYFWLANEVIADINRQTAPPKTRQLPRIMGAVGRLIGRVRRNRR